MITKSPQYVSRTAAGKQISAWVVLYTGRRAGEVAAKVTAHYSAARVLVNVSDIEGYRCATGDRLENALSFLTVDGVRVFDNCAVPKDSAKWLNKSAAIYKKYALPELPDLGIDQTGLSWAEYAAERAKRITPEYRAAVQARNDIKRQRIAAMDKLEVQALARGMRFANGDDTGPKSIYYIAGLDRLAAMGYQVIQAI